MTQPAAASTDQFGERVYLIPDRNTGEIIERPSITRVIGLLASHGLDEWKNKMTAIGVAMRADVAARVIAGHHMEPGKARNQQIRAATKDAIDIGQALDKGWHAADFGTAVHSLTESIDAGRVDLMALPDVIKSHGERYADTMAAFGIVMVGSEISVYSDEHVYGGTIDRFVSFAGATDDIVAAYPELRLRDGVFALDLKTGRVYEKAALQLAAAVNAEGTWDGNTDSSTFGFGDLPADLRKDVGFILQIADAGPAKLIPVRLVEAWPAFTGMCAVARFNKVPPLASPLKSTGDAPNREEGAGAMTGDTSPVSTAGEAPSPAPPAVDVFAGLPDDNGIPQRDRVKLRGYLIERMQKLPPEALLHVAANWPAGVATFKASTEHTVGELEQIDTAVKAAERAFTQPFPDEDPSLVPPVAANDPRIAELSARLAALPSDLALDVAAEVKQTHKIPPLSSGRATEEQLAVFVAAVTSCEQTAAVRGVLIEEALARIDTDRSAVIIGHLKAADPKFNVLAPREWDVEHLDNVISAVAAGILAIRDGELLVDLPAELIGEHKKFSGRRELLAAAKPLATAIGRPKPAKAEEALADPILVAALAAA